MAFIFLIIISVYCSESSPQINEERLRERYSYLQQIIKKNPLYYPAYLELAKIYLKLKKPNSALKTLKKASYIKQDAVLYHLLGKTYIDLGKKEDAEKSFKKAIKLNRRYLPSYLELGDFYKREKRIREAKDAYLSALEIKSDFAEAYWKLGSLYEDFLNPNYALVFYKKAIFHLPQKIKYKLSAANLLYKLKRLSEAKEYYLEILKKKPTKEIYKKLIKISFLQENLREARAYLQEAVEFYRYEYDFHYPLGFLEGLFGNYKKALLHIGFVLGEGKSTFSLYYLYSKILQEAGKLGLITPYDSKRQDVAQRLFVALDSIFHEDFKIFWLKNICQTYINFQDAQKNYISMLKRKKLLKRAQEQINKLIYIGQGELFKEEAEEIDFSQERSPFKGLRDKNFPRGRISLSIEIEDMDFYLTKFFFLEIFEEYLKYKGWSIYKANEGIKPDYTLKISIEDKGGKIKISFKLIDFLTLKELAKGNIMKMNIDRYISSIDYILRKVEPKLMPKGQIVEVTQEGHYIVNLGIFNGLKEGSILKVLDKPVELRVLNIGEEFSSCDVLNIIKKNYLPLYKPLVRLDKGDLVKVKKW